MEKNEEKKGKKIPTKLSKEDLIIKKPVFDLEKYKKEEGMDSSVKDKEDTYIPFSDAFVSQTGVGGFLKGIVSLCRGYSDSGKSTAIVEGVVGAQRLGILPVIIDTENSFGWVRAKDMGMEYEEVKDENGKVIDYTGFFIYINNATLIKKYGNYSYTDAKTHKEYRQEAVIEDLARFIDDTLSDQANGKLDVELCFFWDSIGTLRCYKSVISKSSSPQWDAAALSASFLSIANSKIPGSKKEGVKYTNTFVGVQKIYFDGINSCVRHRGGEFFWSASRMIFHFGGIESHGTFRLIATCNGKSYTYGTKVKIRVYKNHTVGVSYEGEIVSTTHGFILYEDKNKYLSQYRKYLLSKLNIDDTEDAIIETFEEEVKDTSDI